jgi:hypothetical protein
MTNKSALRQQEKSAGRTGRVATVGKDGSDEQEGEPGFRSLVENGNKARKTLAWASERMRRSHVDEPLRVVWLVW